MKRRIIVDKATDKEIHYSVEGEYNGEKGYSVMTMERFQKCLESGRFENGELNLYKEIGRTNK